jgi:CSLREA domain-containing protein
VRHVRRFAGVALALALVAAAPQSAPAATIAVSTETDTVADDGYCSLREAIVSANADAASGATPGECPAGAGADMVTLGAGLYELTTTGPSEDASATGDLDILTDLTVSGAGAASTTISGAGHDRVVDVAVGTTVSIMGVTLADGQAPAGTDGGPAAPGSAGGQGGGIRNNGGDLTVTDSVVRDNVGGAGGNGGAGGATGGAGGNGGPGGGIFTTGKLTLVRSSVIGNSGGPGGMGGVGTAGTTGTGGAGGQGGQGGGIAALGPLVVTDSTIAGNAAGDGGTGANGIGTAGADQAGPGSPGGSAVGGDGGAGGAGGGIAATDRVSLTNPTLDRNEAGSGGTGGGASGGFGGHGSPGGAGGNASGGTGGAGGNGGAVAANPPAGSDLTALNMTLDHNSAGDGGIGGAGFAGWGGSGAVGQNGGDAGDLDDGTGGAGGRGGGTSSTGTVSITHATLSANRAGAAGVGTVGVVGFPGLGGGGGGVTGQPSTNLSGKGGAPGTGGGASVLSGSTTFANTIVSRNAPGDCAGAIVDGGHNMRYPFGFFCPGAVLDPQLRSLAANGGPVETRAPARGSPAIDAVPASGAGCPATDARGVPRPQGGACDTGAYEVAPPLASTGAATAITDVGATVNGDLTPNGRTTSFHFDYGTTTAYGSRTPDAPGGAGIPATPVSAAIVGLPPSTTYHYRLVATNGDGTTAGADESFITTSTGGGGTDTTAPVISSASLKPDRFAVDAKGAAETAVAARARKGTTFRYTLSEPARVVFTIQRQLPGRKVGKRCRKPSRSNRAQRKCKRYKAAGRFAQQSAAGAVRKRFSGRIGKRKLKPGGYRAVLVATDAAGNHSTATRLSFRVVRR